METRFDSFKVCLKKGITIFESSLYFQLILKLKKVHFPEDLKSAEPRLPRPIFLAVSDNVTTNIL